MTNIVDLSIAQIDAGTDRPRELDPGHAQGLADSIAMQGLICPVIVRNVGSDYRLVDGLHRLQAFRILGRETITAILSDKENDDEAMLDAVIANIARRMSAYDFCQHLHKLKKVWMRLHPDAGRGGDRKSEKIKLQTLEFDRDDNPVVSFSEAMADRFGLSKAAIFEAVAIWDGLSAPSKATLRGTALSEKKTELKALSKESKARQEQILELILSEGHPDIQNVAEALFHLENGVTPTRFERQFLAAKTALARLDDVVFDRVIELEEARIIASLKRRGRI